MNDVNEYDEEKVIKDLFRLLMWASNEIKHYPEGGPARVHAVINSVLDDYQNSKWW